MAPGREPLRSRWVCLGYVANCESVVHGSLLTTVCRDLLPCVDRTAMLAAGADVAGLSGLFPANPYFAACDAWGAAPADPSRSQPMALDTPVLAMTGQFDPFTGPGPTVAAASPGISRADYVTVPNQSYNTLFACPRQIRGAWLNDLGRRSTRAATRRFPS